MASSTGRRPGAFPGCPLGESLVSMKILILFLFVLFLEVTTVHAETSTISPVTKKDSVSPPAMETEKGHLHVIFTRDFTFQKIRAGLDTKDHWIFLTLFHDHQVLHIDQTTGKNLKIDAYLRRPEFAAFDPETRNLIVSQGDSRDYYVIPVGRYGPPVVVRTGLNPSWAGGAPGLGYYILAGAVHLLYRLDSHEVTLLDWMALGDRIKNVTLDRKRKRLYFPMYRKERLATVSIPDFRKTGEVELGDCEHPRQVFSGTDSGKTDLILLCRDGIYEGDEIKGDFRRIFRLRKKSGMMARVGGTGVLAISFPESRMVRLWSIPDQHFFREIRFDGRPVFLLGIPQTADFLLVTDNPLERRSRVRLIRWTPDKMLSPVPAVPRPLLPLPPVPSK